MPITVRPFNSDVGSSNYQIDVGSGDGDTRSYTGDKKSKIPLIIDKSMPSGAYIKPNEDKSGHLDIIRESAWTTSPLTSRDVVIPIVFTEYQPYYGSIAADIFHTVKGVMNGLGDKDAKFLEGGILKNPIAHSFLAKKTNLSYTLPYLQLQAQDFSTQFGDGDEPSTNIFQDLTSYIKDMSINNANFGGDGIMKAVEIGGVGAGFLGKLTKDVGRLLFPAINPADPQGKYYGGSSPVGYEITIELLNTIDIEKTRYHKELVELWSHNMGMANIRNSLIGDSPCIYTVEIEGLRWCPAAHIDFSYVGNGNLVTIDGMNVPESYTCTFKVNEIFPPIRAIFHNYWKNGTRLHAINTDPNAFCSALKQAIELANGGLRALRNA